MAFLQGALRCDSAPSYPNYHSRVSPRSSGAPNLTLASIVVYFMVGLSGEAARFFKFLLILVEYSMSMTLFVRVLPAFR